MGDSKCLSNETPNRELLFSLFDLVGSAGKCSITRYKNNGLSICITIFIHQSGLPDHSTLQIMTIQHRLRYQQFVVTKGRVHLENLRFLVD